MEPFIGEIRMFGGNFAPRGWALCNGQLMSIAQNTALFSILGTTYGGDGRTTFALPNLQGRFPMHWGRGAGLSDRQIGEQGGSENAEIIKAPGHGFGPGDGGVSVTPPFTAVSFIIALEGIFPSRS